MRRWIAAALVLVMLILHQDLWLWTDKSLVLGFLPAGLAYHAAYTVAAAVVMAILVWLIWPTEMEDVQPEPGTPGTEAREGSDH